MSEPLLRRALPGEETRLRPLWRVCFGDTEDFIACYEARMFRPDRVELAVADGEAVSMLTVVPAALSTPEGEFPGGYVYGVATLPAHQRRGLAAGLLRRAVEGRLGRGTDFLTLVPDTPDLFPYYERAMDARPAFTCREVRGPAGQWADRDALPPVPVDAGTYCTIREGWLAGRPYIRWGRETVDFQKEVCRQSGGDLFRFPGVCPGCAAAEYEEDGTLLVSELLAEETDLLRCLAGLLARMPAQRLLVRMPPWMGNALGGEVQPFACITRGGPAEHIREGYLGLDLA